MTLEVITLEGRTPVLFFDIPGTGAKATGKTVLLYGHLDKQPEMTGWRDDSGPWTPLLEDGKLYGRGSADDGYAVFAAMAAVLALDAENISRPRCVGLIETCEESGSVRSAALSRRPGGAHGRCRPRRGARFRRW